MTDPTTAIEHIPADAGLVAAHVVEVIARAAADPTVDVGKLERLLAMQERILADQRRTAFLAGLARLQARLPQVAKTGRILDRDGAVRNRYARIEDVDVAIRPLCAEEGFSFSFDSAQGPTGITYTCDLHHRDGHTERKTLTLPIDAGQGRNAVQSVGSTTSYARRYLIGMHLHLVTRDEDDDGAGGGGTVTADQASELRRRIAEVRADEARFLRWAGAETVESVPAARYEAALKMLEEKRRQAK